MSIAYIGLGSNIGDRRLMLRHAVELMGEHKAISILAESSLYESPALLDDDADPSWNKPFINGVVQIDTGLQAIELLHVLQAIELQLGKEKRGHWAPREIDLDILAYGDEVIESPELIVPHPYLHVRAFVVVPMHDVVPDWHYPAQHDGLGGTSLASFKKQLDCTHLKPMEQVS